MEPTPSPPFAYGARITGPGSRSGGPAQVRVELRTQIPDIDLLPSVEQRDAVGSVSALLDDATLKAVLRAGYTVTIDELHEGPPDPTMLRSDEEAEAWFARRLGAERMQRGRRS